MSTHFDELNITAPDGSSTPEPPGLSEATFNHEVKSAEDTSKPAFNPIGKSAVYASKPEQLHLSDLNTLVPEDFNLIDFNFKDLSASKESKHPEVIKTDHTFDDIVVPPLEAMNTPVITSEPVKEEKESTPIVLPAPVIIEEPLLKVSKARKSLEPQKAAEMEETKNAESKKIDPIIIAEVPESAKKVEPAVAKVVENDKKAESAVESDKENIKPAQKEETSTAPAISNVQKAAEAVEAEEVSAPPPLPTNNAHLVAVRESLKPTMLPVKPVSGAPASEPSTGESKTPVTATSPLAKTETTSEDLEAHQHEIEAQKLALEEELNSQKVSLQKEMAEHKAVLEKEMNEHKAALEREIDTKKALEAQLQAIISKSNAQEEALKYKNESLDQLNSDFLKTNNDLTSARSEKARLEAALAKAEAELAATSESNAKAFLEKSDEVTALKDKLAEFAAIIGQKNKEIASLEKQLEETKRSNMQTALESVQQYEKIEDELVKMVEVEILRMQDTIDEQREYNSKLQMEVDAEYAYWKAKLSSK